MCDCKNAQNFIKEWERMCKWEKKYHNTKANGACSPECPLQKLKEKTQKALAKQKIAPSRSCRLLMFDMDVNELVMTVQSWSDMHPAKTMQTEFLKLNPKARIDPEDGLPVACAGDIYGFECPFTEEQNKNNECCKACWNTPTE